ncbi:GNAT family acetyltransferase, putative [Trichophyton verrucosum HKI 0517]|uniref:GNAT family acetyltransferase, putative n=1 Tax=Trichophyton verrucosum (strain HKI 0517) TaxID=663202 RepID=D4DFB7_TRIVH|nr:GNAT family acetyltransferase, putative [Trichophyton verrucosum HKI 0517]EFE39466.1 GNAT family acetyltransferase, putative [Trichophyton verrucosum HKI 0517]
MSTLSDVPGLILEQAQESDAQHIVDIHIKAFSSNLMLLAQFPTATAQEGLKTFLIDLIIQEIRDPGYAVFVVRDAQGCLVSFARWCLPRYTPDPHREAPSQLPEGTDMEVLNAWSARVLDVTRKVIGDTPHYHMTFIATDPKYEHRGAATLLMRQALEQCTKETVPLILEGTLNAIPFYMRLGLVDEGSISMDLEGIESKHGPSLYEERLFVFRPRHAVN